jgi:hypothetical protein
MRILLLFQTGHQLCRLLPYTPAGLGILTTSRPTVYQLSPNTWRSGKLTNQSKETEYRAKDLDYQF